MKTATGKKVRLSQRTWHTYQSWHYNATWDFMGEKLQVNIKRDSYDFQSYRSVSIYDPAKKCWNSLCKLPFDESAHSHPINWTAKTVDIKLFEADEQELLKEAALILG